MSHMCNDDVSEEAYRTEAKSKIVLIGCFDAKRDPKVRRAALAGRSRRVCFLTWPKPMFSLSHRRSCEELDDEVQPQPVLLILALELILVVRCWPPTVFSHGLRWSLHHTESSSRLSPTSSTKTFILHALLSQITSTIPPVTLRV